MRPEQYHPAHPPWATPTPTLNALIDLLNLETLDTCHHVGRSTLTGTARVYGGQLLAQSLMAMTRSANVQQTMHSMQALFLRAGDIAKDILYTVTPLKDGRSFSARQVTATQDDAAIFTATASFHDAREGQHERFERQPDTPSHEQCESETDFYDRVGWEQASSDSFCAPFFTTLFERRSTQWRHPKEPGATAPNTGFWCRVREPVGDQPALHQALLAYFCDLDLMFTSMRPRGRGSRDSRMHGASLDHVMWMHRPLRVDDWFYYDLGSPFASSNRGLGRGAVYQDGLVACTVMQEGLLRESA